MSFFNNNSFEPGFTRGSDSRRRPVAFPNDAVSDQIERPAHVRSFNNNSFEPGFTREPVPFSNDAVRDQIERPAHRRSDHSRSVPIRTRYNSLYKGCTLRLSSFVTFPQNTIWSGAELAAMGYKFNDTLNIECTQCGFTVKPTTTDIIRPHRSFLLTLTTPNTNCSVVARHEKLVLNSNIPLAGIDQQTDIDGATASIADYSKRLYSESDSIAQKVGIETSRFRFEAERLKSFAIKPVEHASTLAKNGFYLAEGGKVQCYACGFGMMAWAWQTVFELHSIKSTGCPFFVGKAYNVSIEQGSIATTNGNNSPRNSFVNHLISQSPFPDSTSLCANSDISNKIIPPPKRILDSGFIKRLVTYIRFHDDNEREVSAINCASAGFVFKKVHNKRVLKCLECSIIMVNTMAAVDMMIEHASCATGCSFVTRVKGIEYFKNALEIRNIALSKAGKGPLNMRVHTFNKMSFSNSSTIANLPPNKFQFFEKETKTLTSLGYPPKLVMDTILEKIASADYKIDEKSSLQCLNAVQFKHLSNYFVISNMSQTDSIKSTLPTPGSSDKSPPPVQLSNWPPDMTSDEVLGRCLQCLENPITTQVSDCRHICLCSTCAPFVTKCPQCLGQVKAYTKLFISDSGGSSQSVATKSSINLFSKI